MRNDECFMTIALEESNKAALLNEIPVGCIIVYENQIIAKNHNLKETLNRATAHAEILAIEEASNFLNKWRLEDCTLYVTLEPCAMCASAIVQSRIKRVVIGTKDNKNGAVISSRHIFENNHNHELLVKTNVLEEECNEILIRFLKNKRK